MRVAVIGLGKLGLCTAACFAAGGHEVFAYDTNESFLEQLRNRRCPIDEDGLEGLLNDNWERLTWVNSAEEAVDNTDITAIIVPTPSTGDGSFSNKYVEQVLKDISPALQRKKEFHVVDVISTVMPDSCDKIFKPLLENGTGKQFGVDFGLVYNPEFIALGSVIKNFLNPDMLLVGCSDAQSATLMRELYNTTCRNEPYFAAMSLINAEITKLSLNCFVTMKISFVNELSAMCEKVDGADIDTITSALGADTRIGHKYLKGGLGFGGTCFPRDNLAFQSFARGIGRSAKIGPQVVKVNEEVIDRIYKVIVSEIPRGSRISLLGLSYKSGTHIIEESQSIMLAERLISDGYKLSVHDPKALVVARDVLGNTVKYCNDIYDCVTDANGVILMTNWSEYELIDWNKVANLMVDNAVVIDSWRVAKNSIPISLNYWPLGLGQTVNNRECVEV